MSSELLETRFVWRTNCTGTRGGTLAERSRSYNLAERAGLAGDTPDISGILRTLAACDGA
jgi:hypothetical protein